MAEGPQGGLYRPHHEHDGCGFGLMVDLNGRASSELVADGIKALKRLTHRGAVSADGMSGDGCGVAIGQPETFLRSVAVEAGIALRTLFASGIVFLNRDAERTEHSRRALEEEIERVGLEVAGFRRVPTNPSFCGEMALAALPTIEQIFINAPPGLGEVSFERRLFLARRRAEKRIYADDETFYITSLSSRNLLYKGMVMPQHLDDFYPDLRHPEMQSHVVLFHQRFSTNTLPEWWLAQPFRLLAHNGEINTLRGNRTWARARGPELQPADFPEWQEMLPMVEPTGSDSSSLDNMLEALVVGGLNVLHAIRILMPPAWEARETQDPDINAFYEYHGLHMEPWDGPAGVVLNDGRYAACALDRNGLRPARWWQSRSGRLTVCSEAGVNDDPACDIVAKGKLGPGDVLAVDLASGEVLHGLQIDDRLKRSAPYRKWLRDGVRYMDQALFDPRLAAQPLEPTELTTFEKLFNITTEERYEVLRPLAMAEMEAIGSMGDDAPIAALSRRIRPLYDCFRQMFAQVTNPPIDPLREKLVMSLQTRLGRKSNLFVPSAERAHHVVLNSPVLSQSKLRQLLAIEDVSHQFLDLHVPENWNLKRALDDLCERAEKAVAEGKLVLLLSDRYPRKGRIPMHALLATAAVHQHLVEKGLRCRCNLIVETGTARDPHHFACLIGYGATAVYPFMAYQCLYDMTRTGELGGEAAWRELGRSYRRGIRKGLLKILSKMGISTIASYRGAQLFEVVGLDQAVVDRCFPGSDSRLGGKDLDALHAEQRRLAARAWDSHVGREHGGEYRYRPDGEFHMYHPEVVRTLQVAAATGLEEDFQAFADIVNGRPPAALRDLLALRKADTPMGLEEVEPLETILRRFECAGMSLGALSHEAHEAIAVAMNTIGGRSNSGEGGEDPARSGTLKASKIRQVASGRFGVTPDYLVQAEAIQIKIAQGAKPGEGGQLPGHKVDARIAQLRYSSPGVGLISPPPHHDIYSIEDLAQLIFDLKQVNPGALISVKLVAEPGVGTIAAGVAKAYADMITVSGHDGGTGASPLTSVKYAGSPWELGLAEAQQVLIRNGLRSRVRLQTDGGLKTGLDVIKAAILGAESYGFGTAPLIALGCKYLRICHLNNCATGIATQNEVLRARFYKGKPDLVINYFRGVAREVRQWLGVLGVRKLDEIIGRTDLLEALPDTRGLDLDPLLWRDERYTGPRYCVEESNVPFDRSELAEQMVEDTSGAIADDRGGEYFYDVQNFHRSIGARVSGEIARRYGNRGLSVPVKLHLRGTAGQSLGVWNAPGLEIDVVGEANDYVGKGMAGGRVVLRPPADAAFEARHAPIMGNTCLYGATGGELFAAGQAGERFAVRNSGAVTVVEGVGDHCCEYMTSGIVVVLGRTGVNFGAGMTGGFAYVLDEKRDFVDRYNHELIDIHRISREYMEAHVQHLHGLVERHTRLTESAFGKVLLEDFRRYLAHFWIVKPKASDLGALVESLKGAA